MKPIFVLIAFWFLAFPILFISCVSKQYPMTQNYQETQYRTEYAREVYTENQTSLSANSGERQLYSYFNWSAAGLSFQGHPGIYYLGYDVPDWTSYDNISLRLSIWRQQQFEPASLAVFDMSKTGHVPSPEPLLTEEIQTQTPGWYLLQGNASETWLKSANAMLNKAKFLGGYSYFRNRAADPQVIVLNAGRPSSIAVIFSAVQNKWNEGITVDALWTRNTIVSQQVTRERQVERQVPYQVQKQRTVYQIRQVPIWETIFSP
jgi:hypothetical protein